MKNHFKKVVAGMLFGAVAITSVAVVATDGLRTLENVKVGGIRIVIDNKEFTCTDANGTVVEPMIYNGTTYIPVRAVSTAFGKAVLWDGEESTIYLGKMDGKLEEPTIKLTDLKNIAEHHYDIQSAKNVFSNYEDFYSSAIYHSDGGWRGSQNDCLEVLLDKKYSKFKATLFIPKGTTWKTGETDFITVVCDDAPKFKSIEMDKTTRAVDIEVDVTDVNDFKIIFKQTNGIRIANAGFYQ